MKTITLFDTTLRDGAQTSGVDFSPADKRRLAALLDDFGIPYIEAGWPGANDTDNQFFGNPPVFQQAKLTAFGMTRRVGRSASNDDGLAAVLNSSAEVACLVGKTWDRHVTGALKTTTQENLQAIYETVKHAKSKKSEVVYDLEHFFDAYKHKPDYALDCLRAAQSAGADWLVMCDTNGGAYPHEIRKTLRQIGKTFDLQHMGIHTHDDRGMAVANTIEAVQAGVRMVQGTLNGLGERCGNANLITLIPLLKELGYDCGITDEKMVGLKSLSHALDDILDRVPDERAPFVGRRAFVHKGGLHGSAAAKDPTLYEHFVPESVGNRRHFPMSDQGGLANLEARLKDFGIPYSRDDGKLRDIIKTIKTLESGGYAYDLADASFELLVRQTLGDIPHYFYLEKMNGHFEIQPAMNEAMKVSNNFNRLAVDTKNQMEATVKLVIGNERKIVTAEGNGPVNAIDQALRKSLEDAYPVLKNMELADYKVRIPTSKDATGATTVVRIESRAVIGGQPVQWTTIGVSENIIEASAEALLDAYDWYLLRTGTPAIKPNAQLLRNGSNARTIGTRLP